MAPELTLNDMLVPQNIHRAPRLPASHSWAAGAHPGCITPGFVTVPQEKNCLQVSGWLRSCGWPESRSLTAQEHAGPQPLVAGRGDRRYQWSVTSFCHSPPFVGTASPHIVKSRVRATRQLPFWSQLYFCTSLPPGADWCLSLVPAWLQQATQLMRPSSGWYPARVLPVISQLLFTGWEGWELRNRFPPQQQHAGSWPALQEARARLLAGIAFGCWNRSETAQVAPWAYLPALTPTQRVSAADLEYSQEEDSSLAGKRVQLHKHILYHLAAGLKSFPQPILVFI